MMRVAFDTLNRHLPDESEGFFAEAHALALESGLPQEILAHIEAEYLRLAQVH